MPKAIILMYHNIDYPPKGARIPNLYVTPRMFRFQMWYLKAAGFRVVSIQDLVAAVEEGDIRHNMAAITFDDGYTDFYNNAYPILKHYGYQSTVYVVSGLVGKNNVWDSKSETHQKQMMDWDHIVEVSENKVQIGSHTRSHPELTTLSDAMLDEELTGSKNEIESRVNHPVVHFCYPYGDSNDRIQTAVRKAGYRFAVTTKRGHVEKGNDPISLRRIPIKLITNPFSFLYKIHTKSEKRKGKQLLPRIMA
jgi:peptidoglycan/xylan/chitin deacetylase (PgdA/CDA1 family)